MMCRPSKPRLRRTTSTWRKSRFTRRRPSRPITNRVSTFEYVVTDMEYNSLSDDQTKNMGTMGDAGGTGVPGLTSSDRPEMTVSSFAETEAAPDYLSGVAIADDEVDNYNEAIEEGRAVAVYSAAGGDMTAAEVGVQSGRLEKRPRLLARSAHADPVDRHYASRRSHLRTGRLRRRPRILQRNLFAAQVLARSACWTSSCRTASRFRRAT